MPRIKLEFFMNSDRTIAGYWLAPISEIKGNAKKFARVEVDDWVLDLKASQSVNSYFKKPLKLPQRLSRRPYSAALSRPTS
ncbi:hypothetical protein [Thalassobium sp. R2A62]|uniref:hypothetical protein n=1 Tax=Thalassobium sp. R2A62 TaxID=633131 RepID=UPI0001B1D821|nr:hypothetical protein [Thalassobium sp. R2A62]EET49761.1 hypothetical protein TR2A62_3283 [Thalassobium sp. R2A62]